MAVSVSLHTKSTSVSLPVAQSFPHGLGETPKAAIFVMSRGVSGGYVSNAFYAVGFTDGTTSFSVALASDGANATASNATSGRRADPLHAVLYGETTPVIGTFVSWDSTNINLSWTANNNEAWNIGIIAIGGATVSAKVVTWATGTTTGNLSITGAGFTPTTAIHLHDGRESAIVPSLGADAHIGIGAVDSGGSQWYVYARAADGSAFSVCGSDSGSDAVMWKMSQLNAEDGKASHVSFGGDGETVNRETATAGSMTVGTLFLKGIQTDAITFAKSTNTSVPVAQNAATSISPVAVLLASDCKVSGAVRSDARFTLGVAGSGAEATFQYQDVSAADPTLAFDFVSTTKGIVLSDDDTPTTTAEADVTLSGSNVALSWTTNNANALVINGLAFGAIDSAGGKGSGGKGKGGQTPGPGEPPKKPLRTSLSKSWKWDRGWR
jgi:hypothetical protein